MTYYIFHSIFQLNLYFSIYTCVYKLVYLSLGCFANGVWRISHSVSLLLWCNFTSRVVSQCIIAHSLSSVKVTSANQDYCFHVAAFYTVFIYCSDYVFYINKVGAIRLSITLATSVWQQFISIIQCVWSWITESPTTAGLGVNRRSGVGPSKSNVTRVIFI